MRNSAGTTTSQDQNFFLYPIHGHLLRNAKIRIHYTSTFPLGLGSYFCGATFGRHVYLTESARHSGARLTPAFQSQLHLLIHELAHCAQYQDLGWSLSRFAWKYLCELCKAGFNYEKNVMESEAFALEDHVDHLLYTSTGRQFFHLWRERGLVGVLGYPIAKTYTALNAGVTGLDELEFERGVLQISARGCYRYGRKGTIDGKRLTCAGLHLGACR